MSGRMVHIELKKDGGKEGNGKDGMYEKSGRKEIMLWRDWRWKGRRKYREKTLVV